MTGESCEFLSFCLVVYLHLYTHGDTKSYSLTEFGEEEQAEKLVILEVREL